MRPAMTDSFTDWSQRPLSDSQIDYAADDVVYRCVGAAAELDAHPRLAGLLDQPRQIGQARLRAEGRLVVHLAGAQHAERIEEKPL